MATAGNQQGVSSHGGFPIARFKELYNKSYAMSLLAPVIREQIERAMEEEDVNLLGKIYQTLLAEQASEKKNAQDFDSAKNKIIDDYVVAATDIRKRYTEQPMKQKSAAVAEAEKTAAEEMINKI